MLSEITIPDDYTGSLEQENDIISKINNNFMDIEKSIGDISEDKVEFTSHVIDFEEYEIDLYYSDNKTKAKILLDDDIIVVTIGENQIRIDKDGNVI